MPPKNAKTKSHPKEMDVVSAKVENRSGRDPVGTSTAQNDTEDTQPIETNGSNTSKKRKSPPATNVRGKPAKAPKQEPRQGTRTSSRTKSSNAPSDVSPRKIINFLLSEEALPYCYPADDLEAPQAKTYSKTSPAEFSPFEHLLTASLLSKPLNHRLGIRSTRTLLNPPYSFNTPENVIDAGEAKVLEALEAAKTQHRQKTAAYISDMAHAFQDGDAMTVLKEMANEKGLNGVINEIGSTVAGMGQTGAEIFCRRIQCVDGWGDAVWPFADERAFKALRELGIDAKDADELQDMLEHLVNWDKIGTMGLNDGSGSDEPLEMEQQIQVEFVVLLERAVGASLEGKVQQVKDAALGARMR